MSFIGELVFDVAGNLFGDLLWRGGHATGRRLVFLLSLGWVRIPSLRHGGGSGWANFAAFAVGLVFWLALGAGALYLAFA